MAITSRVIPIAGSNVIWGQFLKDVTEVTGRSPMKGADASGLQLSSYAKYIAALGELRAKQVCNPIDTLQTAGSLLCHLHFSFIIVGSSNLIFKISESTKLDIITTRIEKGRFALVSGSLKEWKDAIVELSSAEISNIEMQWVTETLLDFFSQFGLKYIFSAASSKIGKTTQSLSIINKLD